MTSAELTQEVDNDPNSLPATATTDYGYDALGQLTSYGPPDSPTPQTFTAAGNRTTDTMTAGNEVSYDGTWNYQYDQEGNETLKYEDDTTYSYTYDNQNLMTSAQETVSGTVVMDAEYRYNAFGNMVEEDVTTLSGTDYTTTMTQYVIDDWNPAKAGATGQSGSDVLADLYVDPSTGSTTLATHYVWGDCRLKGTFKALYIGKDDKLHAFQIQLYALDKWQQKNGNGWTITPMRLFIKGVSFAAADIRQPRFAGVGTVSAGKTLDVPLLYQSNGQVSFERISLGKLPLVHFEFDCYWLFKYQKDNNTKYQAVELKLHTYAHSPYDAEFAKGFNKIIDQHKNDDWAVLGRPYDLNFGFGSKVALEKNRDLLFGMVNYLTAAPGLSWAKFKDVEVVPWDQ